MVTSSYEWKSLEWDDKTQTNRHFFTSNDVCKLSLLKFLRYLWGNANRLVHVVVICRCMRYPSVWIISYFLDTLEMKCIRNRDMPHAFALYFLIIFLTFETFARLVKWRVGRISLHFWRTFGQSIFFFRHCCEFQDFTKPNPFVLFSAVLHYWQIPRGLCLHNFFFSKWNSVIKNKNGEKCTW